MGILASLSPLGFFTALAICHPVESRFTTPEFPSPAFPPLAENENKMEH